MSGATYTVATQQRTGALRGRRGPALRLAVVEGPDAGRGCALDPARPCTVGTAAENTLVLSDTRVSRRHLELAVQPEGRVLARDLGSRNGTRYEGSKVREALLAVGATLAVGHTYLRVLPVTEPLALAPSRATRFGELVGESLAMREVFAALERASEGDVTLLLEGETGTGKELAARAVHERSSRRKGPFVAVDCAALPEGLVESELSGHVKGAFTGAVAARRGAFVRAHRGTLFLDELDSVPLAAQARLLRAVEERRVRAVGSDDEQPVDVRIIAGARVDLAGCVAAGSFRADLYYRLSVLRVCLPPLRARREDLGLLVRELLARRGVRAPGAPSLEALRAHAWPGNVRELRNVVERALALCPHPATLEALPLAPGPLREAGDDDALAGYAGAELPWAEAREAALRRFERRYLAALWAQSEGNVSAAARRAGLDRKHLRGLLVKHGLLRRTASEGAGASDDDGRGG